MSSPVRFALDASAVLALLQNEPGHENVRGILAKSWLHSINTAEVIGKLMRSGAPRDTAIMAIADLQIPIREQFSFEQAEACGTLLSETRPHGLSLGDCVCLTAAAWEQSEVVTAEHRWKNLEGRRIHGCPLRIRLIR